MQVRRWALAAGYNLLQSNTTLHRGKNDFSPSRECEEHNSPRLSDESSASAPVTVFRPQRPCKRVCKRHKVSRAIAQRGTLAYPALTRIQRSAALCGRVVFSSPPTRPGSRESPTASSRERPMDVFCSRSAMLVQSSAQTGPPVPSPEAPACSTAHAAVWKHRLHLHLVIEQHLHAAD